MTTWPRRALPLGIALLTVVAFLPALAGSFLNWDDNVNFLENTAYRGLGPEQIRWAFTSVLFGHYIPLTRLSFSRSHALGGMDPRGYHLASLLLHVANAVAFYFVARRLLAAGEAAGVQAGRRESGIVVAATVAALVFGIHPLRVESVAWITGRADLLCGGFVLLTAWAYLRAALVLQGRYQDAEAPLAAYMAREPGAASGPERLGLVHLVQRRYEAAIPLLREALARKPTAPDLPKQLAQALCGHARRLSARAQAAEVDALVDEARRLGADAAACRAGAGEPER